MRTPCGKKSSGGCCTTRPPAPRKSSPSTSKTSTWSFAAPASSPRAAPSSTCTGRGRLSYPRAEYLFKSASAKLDPHRQGWTLHQLRHSALQHLAQAGRTAPELQAKSRHQHLASLGRYVRLGEETSARLTAEADPAQRRRTR
ncbi:hypothetical protein DMB42_42575 [Nonomuraea sp. WAC 01424]|nr:hypothetical protein DMB42_42575 [Nonomuraea sp. WAC 01424]